MTHPFVLLAFSSKDCHISSLGMGLNDLGMGSSRLGVLSGLSPPFFH